MRPTLALLGLLLACDSAAPSPQADQPEPSDDRGAAPPAIDRGLILSTPTVHVSTVMTTPPPEDEPVMIDDEVPAPLPELGSLEALETELRARLPEHRLACTRVKRLPCKSFGDLDADSKQDIVALVEPAGRRSLGLAILWGHGGVDLLGAGKRGQHWTMQFADRSERELVPADLSWMARWVVWDAEGPEERRRGFTDGRKRKVLAPAVKGDGILIEGGGAETIVYHDGKHWRVQHLGVDEK